MLIAFADRAILVGRGFDRAPSALWGLVPFLYLVIRSVRVTGASMVPAFIWLVLQGTGVLVVFTLASNFTGSILAPPGMSTAAPGLTPPFTVAERAHLLTAQGMQEKIVYDYEHPAANTPGIPASDAQCTQLASTEPFAETTCSVKLAGQKFTLTIVVQDDSAETPFYIANQQLVE
jgi:hypothetical protein